MHIEGACPRAGQQYPNPSTCLLWKELSGITTVPSHDLPIVILAALFHACVWQSSVPGLAIPSPGWSYN